MTNKIWCKHIHRERAKTLTGQVKGFRWCIKMPIWFNDWEQVPKSWTYCPVCGTPKPKRSAAMPNVGAEPPRKKKHE